MMILGYRSDVRIATSKKNYQKLKEHVKEYLQKHDKNYNLLESCDVMLNNEEICYFGWDHIKWYDGCEGFEHIAAIESGLDYLEENDMSFTFARMGENYDDYEERNNDAGEENFRGYIPYPSVIRKFDDIDLKQELDNMKFIDKNQDLEVAI